MVPDSNLARQARANKGWPDAITNQILLRAGNSFILPESDEAKGRAMKAYTIIVVAALSIPITAFAQSGESYECTMGSLVRRVAIEREGSAPVPCEVAYYKDSEAPGQREVLWSAQNDTAYCGARISEFVSRLGDLGWQCSVSTAPATEPESVRNDSD
jgi:hypothetical protein